MTPTRLTKLHNIFPTFCRCCSDIKRLRNEREFIVAAKRILDKAPARPIATSNGTTDEGPVYHLDNNNNGVTKINKQYAPNGIRYS